MSIRDDERFIKRVEGLIDPAEVCDLNFIQRFKRLLPASVFKNLLFKTSRRFPYIGFVIEPYAVFLFFRLKDADRARALLPARYELVKTRIIADEEPGYFHGMGIFNTKGSTFWGTRLESYLIARDRETGLISWIFLDILSNTLIALPKTGVADRNCAKAVHTTNSKGDIFIEIEESGGGRRLELRGNINRGVRKPLDKDLWIGGNTSIAFVEKLSGGDQEPFAVIFDPAEVETALDIPVADIRLAENCLAPDLAEKELSKVLCFPFTQHYIADSPGCRTFIRDEQDMIEKYLEIAGREELRTFSTSGIKKLMAAGVVLSLLGVLALAAALVSVHLS